MHNLSSIDKGKVIDWGKTSEEYAKYRPGPPQSFYQKLIDRGIGLSGQSILDLGTGTGVLARQFAKQGSLVTGIDISAEQINMAKALASKENLDINLFVSSANEIDIEDNSFNIITANQCWLYFDSKKAISEVKRLLIPGGIFSTSHICWLPLIDEVAGKTEELILQHNPTWSAGGYSGNLPETPSWAASDFKVRDLLIYDVPVQFTKESWKGRMRACRGVGVVMNDEELTAFEADLDILLDKMVDDNFEVLHRIDAHIFEPIDTP